MNELEDRQLLRKILREALETIEENKIILRDNRKMIRDMAKILEERAIKIRYLEEVDLLHA